MPPEMGPQSTRDCAFRSASRPTAFGPAWLSLFR